MLAAMIVWPCAIPAALVFAVTLGPSQTATAAPTADGATPPTDVAPAGEDPAADAAPAETPGADVTPTDPSAAESDAATDQPDVGASPTEGEPDPIAEPDHTVEPVPEPVAAPQPAADAVAEPTKADVATDATAGVSKADEEPETFGMPPNDQELAAGKTPVKYDKIQYVPGKGVEFESVDDRHKIQMRLRAQMRYTFDHDSADSPAATQSFQIRRARLQFKGNFFGEHNKYKFELAISPRDIGLDRGDGTISKSPLLDWYFDFDYLKSLTIRVGQQKIPYSRQRVISSGNLQLVDRSIANGEFTLDRDIGIDARSKDFLGLGWLRYYLGVYMGEGHSSFEQGDFGMNYLARVEVLPFGMFKDYHEADHNRLKKPRLSIGATYAYLDKGKRVRGITGSRPADEGTTDYHNAEADIMFKWAGWSVFTEAFYRQGTRNPGAIVDDAGDPILDDDGDPITVTMPRNGYGWMAQTGILIPKTKLELAARYAQTNGRGSNTSLTRRDEVGGGPSYYFARHPFKIQADYFRIFNEGDVSDGNHMARIQLQGAF